jgi:hypothetical protein
MTMEEILGRLGSVSGTTYRMFSISNYADIITHYAAIERNTAGDMIKIERNSKASPLAALTLAFEQFDKVISRGYTKTELTPALLAKPVDDEIPF